MRNVFDQYQGAENRLTHSLATALHYDAPFREGFLTNLLAVNLGTMSRGLSVTTQALPGQREFSEAEAERRGIPDIWIYDESTNWCVVIECKITAPLHGEQVMRHIGTARRRGFRDIVSATISTMASASALPRSTITLRWSDIYALLRSRAWTTPWPQLAADYFERLEVRMTEAGQLLDGTLTRFDGIHFDEPELYSYPEAARVLRLALAELRQDADLQTELGMNPKLPGRGAIRGRGATSVWDFLRLGISVDRQFTEFPHLTLGIKHDFAEAVITVPNGLDRTMRKRLAALGTAGFTALAAEIVEAMKPVFDLEPKAEPIVRAIQRRYPSMSAQPFIDALIEADLRTALPGHSIKRQPQWLDGVQSAFASKSSNLQIQFGARFHYRYCPTVGTPAALEVFSRTWRACSPVLRALGLETRS